MLIVSISLYLKYIKIYAKDFILKIRSIVISINQIKVENCILTEIDDIFTHPIMFGAGLNGKSLKKCQEDHVGSF